MASPVPAPALDSSGSRHEPPTARRARHHPGCRDRAGRAGAACHGRPCARAGAAGRLPGLAAGTGAADAPGAGYDDAVLARALRLALCGGDRRHREGARSFRHLVSQRLLSMGMHGGGPRRGRHAVARPHARLAVSRPRPACRDRAHARARRRLRYGHLAGLRGRAHRQRARPLRGLHQSGAAAAAHPASLAAALRHRAQCAFDRAAALHPARSSAARGARDLRQLRAGAPAPRDHAGRPAGDLYAGGLRSAASVA